MRNAVWFGATQFDRQLRYGWVEVQVGIGALQEVQKLLAQQHILVHYCNSSNFCPIRRRGAGCPAEAPRERTKRCSLLYLRVAYDQRLAINGFFSSGTEIAAGISERIRLMGLAVASSFAKN